MVKIINHKFSRWALVALIVVVLAAGTAVVLHTRSVHKAQQASGTIATSKKTKSTTSTNGSGQKSTANQANTSSVSDTTKSSGSSGSTSTVLAAPFGTFVSNHKPGQNGSPSTEQSVCNTTPGASCVITFTMNSVTKTLASQVADPSGSTYWNWDVSKAGFASGSWKITATASLNGQSKSAVDGLPLEVQP